MHKCMNVDVYFHLKSSSATFGQEYCIRNGRDFKLPIDGATLFSQILAQSAKGEENESGS